MEALSESIAPGGGARHETVPIDHLDYSYIEKCSNATEMEKIVKILRSGKEGYYPQLLTTAEERLATLKPKSDVLRCPKPVMCKSDLDQEELTQFQDDIQRWHDEATVRDTHLKEMSESAVTEADLPPVRTATVEPEQKDGESQPAKDKPERIKSSDWSTWEKYDADKEVEKIDEAEMEEKEAPSTSRFPDTEISVSSDPLEREMQATREKNKGNEAFRSMDYDEAYKYYTRSIQTLPTAVAYNNRAMAAIKLNRYSDAIDDCNSVLETDPVNVKAFLRRGVAEQSQGLYVEAEKDLVRVLELEPGNARGKNVLSEVRAKLQSLKSQSQPADQQKNKQQKARGRQLPIVEIEGSENEEERDKGNNVTEGKHSDEQKQETRMAFEEDETAGRLLETSTGITGVKDGKDKDDGSDPAAESTTKVAEEALDKIDINKNPTGVQDGSLEQTDGSNTSRPTVEEHGSDVIKDEKTSTLVDSVNETSQSSAGLPVGHVSPIPAEALQLKDEALSLYQAGDYTQALERYSGAMDAMEVVRELYKEAYATLFSNRAACRNKLGDCHGCIADCDEGLNYNPTNSKLYLKRANAYETLEKYAPAYVNYRAALSIDPNLPVAQQSCSRLTILLRDEFGNDWRNKLPPQPVPVIFPHHPTLQSSATQPLEQPTVDTSVVAEAVAEPVSEEVEEVSTETAPQADDVPTVETFEELKSRGNQLVGKGRFFDAAKVYSQCIEIDNTQVAGFTNRALCHLKLNKPQLALQDCERALELDPQNPKAIYRRAQAKSLLDDQRGAAQDLKNLLKMQPSNSAAAHELERVKELWRKELHKQQAMPEQEPVKQKPPSKKQQTRKSANQPRNTEKRQHKPPRSSTKSGSKTRRNRGESPASSVPPPTPPSLEKSGELRLNDLPKAQIVDPPCRQYMNKESDKEGNKEGEKEGDMELKVDVKDVEAEEPKRTRVVIQEVPSDYESSDDAAGNLSKSEKQHDKEPTVTETTGTPIASELPKPQNTQEEAEQEELPVRLKTLDKGTPYEFLQTWRSVRGQGKTAFIQYAHLLRQIKPESLPTILSNKIDGVLLTALLTTISDYIVADGEIRMGYELLFYLTKVPRFGVVSMFLGNSDKQVVRDAVALLETHLDSGCFSANQLAALRSAYSL